MKTIKVLVIDDSAMVRKILSQELVKDPEIEIVGTAPDPFVGRDKIVSLNPDVLILDIEMPRMDGLTFLQKLMKHQPMPVIVLSSLASKGSEVALKAIELGALEVLAKPGQSYTVGDMSEQLIQKIKAVATVSKDYFENRTVQFSQKQQTLQTNKAMLKTTNKIVAIGASTGGTEAIKQVLMSLPANIPPILIVQHMPQNFTKSFADRLNDLCPFEVKEAEHKDLLTAGKVLIAPGNLHMTLKRSGATYYVEVKDGPLVFHQRPSVEVMFNSVAEYAAKNSVGVILTGMGKDGAKGLLKMREAGAHTIAQNEKTCIVYGMPKEAVEMGAAKEIVALDRVADSIVKFLNN